MLEVQKTYILLLLCCSFFGWASCTTQRSATADKQSGKVTDVNFTQKEEKVFIYYDLHGKKGNTYPVNLKLKTSNGETLDISPSTLEGDIGKKIAPGKGKRIEWNIVENYPNGLNSDKVQFVVYTQNKTDKKKSTWYYYTAGGALILGAGTALIMMLDDGGNGSSLPPPPSRPQ